MFLHLLLSSLLAFADGTGITPSTTTAPPIRPANFCRLPELPSALIPSGLSRVDFLDEYFDGDGSPNVDCVDGGIMFAQFDIGGPVVSLGGSPLECDFATGSIIDDDDRKIPIAATCASGPFFDHDELCYVQYFDDAGLFARFSLLPPNNELCPPGKIMQLEDGSLYLSIESHEAESKGLGWVFHYKMKSINGTIVDVTTFYWIHLRCVVPPTTTTTTTTKRPTTTTTARPTTTTIKPDQAVGPAQLWSVNYYYNYAYGVHAYCAESTCITNIQNNGIGYDMVNGKGLLGKSVSNDWIASVRQSCPTGSSNLRNLAFTKSGYKYLHSLGTIYSTTGPNQGWVSTVNGACGATVPIRRWKSRYTDDMMYGVDLEWNTWYNGMVQDGGAILFYMWN